MVYFYISAMKERDISIDILRGLAIFTMIAANMAAHSLQEPHGFGFRLYGSLAAPMFVFLAGMMVSYTSRIKLHPLKYYLKRGLATLIVAALIDVLLWDILPFMTFDVLYIIGLAMPLIFFFNRINRFLQLGLILLVFGLTPVLQYYLGYTDYPAEASLSETIDSAVITQIPVWRHFLVDGWFPFFPWIGISLLGAFIGSYKFDSNPAVFSKNLLISGLVLMAAGVALWLVIIPEIQTNVGFDGSPKSATFYHFLITREGYSELFYPPTLYYLFTFLGFILIAVAVSQKIQTLKFLKPLSIFGRSSLLVYILHTVFIIYIFNTLDSFTFLPFMGLYLLHATVLWLLCYGVQQVKKGKQFPFIVNFILGG